MRNTGLIERLEQINKELKAYDHIVAKLFDNPFQLSDEERKQFIADNQTDIDKMQELRNEKLDILWKLTPPEKQKEYLDKYSED